ncbi:MAG TPA: hypothetical protein VMR75_00090 [Candidatus Saccharimonadales bacterium]|nr:hypothetical protein [Candidatus Saccharimonadales bacterium]
MANQVLGSQLSPLDKVRKLVALGYDEDDADTLVTNSQVGTSQMMYYEQLPTPDYEADTI